MHAFAVQTNVEATHRDFDKGLMWKMRKGQESKFWGWYCAALKRSETLTLREIPGVVRPIRFDLVASENSTASEEGPSSIVKIMQDVIRNSFEISGERLELVCVVTSMEKGNMTKYRFQFPYCVTDARYINTYIRDKIITELSEVDILGTTKREVIASALRTDVEWNIYGSDEMYLESIYTHDKPSVPLEAVFNPKGANPFPGDQEQGLPAFLSTTYCRVPTMVKSKLRTTLMKARSLPISSIMQSNYSAELIPQRMHQQGSMYQSNQYAAGPNLPTLGAAHRQMQQGYPGYGQQGQQGYPGYGQQGQQVAGNMYAGMSSVPECIGDEDEIEILEKLFPMISTDRADCLGDCIEIGRSVYACYEGKRTGLAKWIAFVESSNTDQIDANECRKHWLSFANTTSMGIRNIGWYARADSPARYKQWNDDRISRQMLLALNLTHTDVARLFWLKHWLDYVCTDLNGHGWYKFENHRWRTMRRGVFIRKLVSRQFRQMIEKERTKLSFKIQNTEAMIFKGTSEAMIKKMGALIDKLGKQQFKGLLVKELAEFFHDEDFEDRVDKNPDLTGLDNGVVEICQGIARIRTGRPGDYITKTTGVSIPKDMSWQHPKVLECIKWFKQCFSEFPNIDNGLTEPDHSLVHYFLRIGASILKSGNNDKVLIFFLGILGNNSKSMIKKLFEYAFGDYCVTFNASVFSSKPRGSGPTPEMAQAMGAKVAFANEPEADDPFRSNFLKVASGDDRFFARKCNKDGGSIEATFLLIMLANQIPPMHADDAMKDRVRSVPFDSVWTYNAPDNEEDQYKERKYKRDRFFSGRIRSMAPAFLWILKEMYSEYSTVGLNEPVSVLNSTKKYWEDNDVFSIFINERVNPVYLHGTQSRENPQGRLDTNVALTVPAAHSAFSVWLPTYSTHMRQPGRSTLKAEMSRRLGNPTEQGWLGYTLAVANNNNFGASRDYAG